MSYLPYVEEKADHWEKIAGDLAADAALDRGPVHAAELRRRERKRLYAYLSSSVRGDHTLLDIYAPLWERRPQGLRPHASNPAAMWRTFPEYEEACKEIDDDLPTSRVPTSERHQNFRIGHMWHCRRCWKYSEAKWGEPPPVAELKRALLPGWTDPGRWSLDPGCYQRLQIHFIRTGYEPRVDPKAVPARGRQRNPPNVYEEYDKMVDYLESLESLPFHVLSKGDFQPPPLASGLLAVVRDSDRRAWEREGVEYPVRPCWNGKMSGVNDMLYDWHFRMAGVDSATRLLKDLRTSRTCPQLGVCGVDERLATEVCGQWKPIGTTCGPSIAGCIKTSENSRQRSPTDLSVGRPTEQHTLPELLLADGRHDLPRLCENSLGDGVPASACNTECGGRASLHREARTDPSLGQSITRWQPPDVARRACPGEQMGHRTPLHGPQTQADMEAKRSEIDGNVHVALEYVRRASKSDPIYLSVTDMSKYYLYLALGRKAQKLTYFSDPRYEMHWGGKQDPPLHWKGRRRGRFGRWRHFLTCPFGLKPLVAYSSAISGEIGQMLIALGIPNNFFIDDDLQVKRGKLASQGAAVVAEAVMSWLGFIAKAAKRQGPARVLKYLGFIFDLDKGELRVTPEHRADLLGRLLALRDSQAITPNELSRLCGKLNWVAQVMWGGVTFIRNILNLMRPLDGEELPELIALTAAANRHLEHWIERLQDPEWEGSWIIPSDHQLPVVTFKSDASGDKMWGYYYCGRVYWCSPMEDELPTTHIQYRELLPLAHAAEHLGALWANQIVRVGVDNSTVAYAMNKGSSPDEWMQALLEKVAVASRKHHFVFIAVHVDRRFNYLADMCTRFQVLQEFESVLPAGVRVPDDPGRLLSACPVGSPVGSSVVFSLPLKLAAVAV